MFGDVGVVVDVELWTRRDPIFTIVLTQDFVFSFIVGWVFSPVRYERVYLSCNSSWGQVGLR